MGSRRSDLRGNGFEMKLFSEAVREVVVVSPTLQRSYGSFKTKQ